MNVKKLLFSLFAVALASMAWSCSSDTPDEPTPGGGGNADGQISVSQTAINTAAVGGEYVLSVTNHTGGGWTAYASDA